MPSREASLRNLERARAAWSHPPRPWRSYKESRVIEQLVWQWFNDCAPRKWSERAVARWLGVSHTYVQKLVRKFKADPDRIRRIQASLGPATFEKAERAREFTRRDRERGDLRGPIRWKLVRFKLQGQEMKAVVPTESQMRRRAAEANGCALGPALVPLGDLPLWARGMPYYSPQNPCDPLIAVKHAMAASKTRQQWPVRFGRRWRPGRPFR